VAAANAIAALAAMRQLGLLIRPPLSSKESSRRTLADHGLTTGKTEIGQLLEQSISRQLTVVYQNVAIEQKNPEILSLC
jgi:hypothetical protein